VRLRSSQTPGCTLPEHLAPGEPNKCAKVGPAWPVCGGGRCNGEPWAYHIVNRYFDVFIPKAIALAEESRQNGTTPYTYMTQSWVASLYLDCANAGMLSWPGGGGAIGRPTLHCPNATAVAAFKAALKRGDIFLHGFPHDGEASYFPDASLFESALTMAVRKTPPFPPQLSL
jgi:hypothetical protein